LFASQIWDDIVTDENGNVIVGAGRDAAASASKARKEKEAKALAAQNASFFGRLGSVISRTDDGD
jgi:regulator of RNase E activity RraA